MSRTLDNVKELYPEWDDVFMKLFQTNSPDDFVLITKFFQPTLEESINQLNRVATDMVNYCKMKDYNDSTGQPTPPFHPAYDRFVRFVKVGHHLDNPDEDPPCEQHAFIIYTMAKEFLELFYDIKTTAEDVRKKLEQMPNNIMYKIGYILINLLPPPLKLEWVTGLAVPVFREKNVVHPDRFDSIIDAILDKNIITGDPIQSSVMNSINSLTKSMSVKEACVNLVKAAKNKITAQQEKAQLVFVCDGNSLAMYTFMQGLRVIIDQLIDNTLGFLFKKGFTITFVIYYDILTEEERRWGNNEHLDFSDTIYFPGWDDDKKGFGASLANVRSIMNQMFVYREVSKDRAKWLNSGLVAAVNQTKWDPNVATKMIMVFTDACNHGMQNYWEGYGDQYPQGMNSLGQPDPKQAEIRQLMQFIGSRKDFYLSLFKLHHGPTPYATDDDLEVMLTNWKSLAGTGSRITSYSTSSDDGWWISEENGVALNQACVEEKRERDNLCFMPSMINPLIKGIMDYTAKLLDKEVRECKKTSVMNNATVEGLDAIISACNTKLSSMPPTQGGYRNKSRRGKRRNKRRSYRY